MSTYHYYECLDHDPPLQSDDEFTQHHGDHAYNQGIDLIDQRPVDQEWWDKEHSYFEANALRFLSRHPKCHVGVINEYGRRVEL